MTKVTKTQKNRRPAGKEARRSAPKDARRPAAKGSTRQRRAPAGRPDGPIARRRRFRTRLLLVVLVLLNVVVAAVWRDWALSLAVLILSVITAPLLAALLLRRR